MNNLPSECKNFNNFSDLDLEGLNLLKFNSDRLLIPKKVEYALSKYVSLKGLQLIDFDRKIAVEKCLVVLDNLSTTYYLESKWKSLNSNILHQQTKKEFDNTFIYKLILDVLKKGTNKGSIIEVSENIFGTDSFSVGKYSKKYKISDLYLKPKLTTYLLKTDYLIERRRAFFFSTLSLASENIIGRNLINIYGRLSLPSESEIISTGKKLVKLKYITKKGKKLTMRNKHSDDYWSDISCRSFVEDNIELYNYLTTDGFVIPNIGSEASGGRVVDSFTLMPSWIRKLIKIDGEETVEIDFKCLHPNIAVSIYSGNRNYITHKLLADKLDIDIKTVKIEHLSFFNKEIYQMKKSVLFEYYEENEPWMLKNILKDKGTNGHKVTSIKMFEKETEIMTEVIKRLNDLGINVLYVYDALLSKKSDYETVKKIMNQVVIEKKIYTIAE